MIIFILYRNTKPKRIYNKSFNTKELEHTYRAGMLYKWLLSIHNTRTYAQIYESRDQGGNLLRAHDEVIIKGR